MTVAFTTLKTNWDKTLVGIIIIVALLLRIWAIDYGLPYPYHMEEPFYTDTAWHLACQGNLDSSLLQPHTYMFAATIFSAEITRFGPTCDQLADESIPPSLLLFGRLVSVATATATVWAVYRLGKRLYSTPVGILGAVFMALNFLHVREAHHGTPDVTTILFITLALWSYARLAERDNPAKRLNYVIAAVLTILSINGRPTAVLLLLPAFYAHLYSHNLLENRNWPTLRRALFDPRLFWAGAVMLLTFVLINPQMWVNPIGYLRYWRGFLSLGGGGGFGRLQVDELSAPMFYLRAVVWGSGLLLSLVMGLGVLWGVWKRSFGDILLILFLVPYFIVASITSVYFARYVIPILPLLCLFAARLIWDVLPKSQPRRAWLAAAAAAILLIQPVLSDLRYSYLLTQTNTRTLALDWIRTNVQPGTKIVTEWHAAPISDEEYALTVVDFYGMSELPMEYYHEQGFEYLIVSSYIRDTVFVSPEEEAHRLEFYAQLPQELELVQEFKPYSGDEPPPYNIDQSLGPITYLDQFERPGPTIQIYKLDTTG